MNKPSDPFRGSVGPVRANRDLLADLRWGAGWAGVPAAVFSLYVMLLTLLRRDAYWPRYQTTTWRIVAAYWCAAALLAAVLAAVRPLLNRRWGAALAGFMGGATVYGAIAVDVGGKSDLSLAAVCAGIGALAGLGLGVVFYDDEHGEVISEKREQHRIAVLVAGGLIAGVIIWATCYPPLCWLGGRYCR